MYIGVDLGGTNIATAVIDENFKIIYSIVSINYYFKWVFQ